MFFRYVIIRKMSVNDTSFTFVFKIREICISIQMGVKRGISTVIFGRVFNQHADYFMQPERPCREKY